jgi:anaerobic selenocysteine-containing dehydrogenase
MSTGREPRWYTPPLSCVGFIATRRGDPERGPKVWMRADDALIRLLTDGEMVRIISPHRQELATVGIDDSLDRGCAVVRDVVGVQLAEVIRVVKPDFDAPNRPNTAVT